MAARYVALFLTLLLLAGCGSQPAANPRIDLTTTVTLPTEPQQSGREPLRVAIAAVISPKETLVHYRELMDYLAAKVDRPVQLIQRSTYAEVNELVRAGSIDVAFICTWAYVDGKSQFGMEILAAPQVDGSATYYSYLLVPAASKAQSLKDLKGGTFAFTDPMSTTGRLMPVYWLWQEGAKPESFFKETIYTYSHDRAVHAVADGLVDGAAVDNHVFEAMVRRDPTLSTRVRVIRKSEPIGTPPVVLGPTLDPVTGSRIRGLLLGMHETAEGRLILDNLQIERWVIPPDAAYDPIRTILRTIGRP